MLEWIQTRPKTPLKRPTQGRLGSTVTRQWPDGKKIELTYYKPNYYEPGNPDGDYLFLYVSFDSPRTGSPRTSTERYKLYGTGYTKIKEDLQPEYGPDWASKIDDAYATSHRLHKHLQKYFM